MAEDQDKKPTGENLVVFPRSYQVAGDDPKQHFVEGVTLDGELVKVRLEINQQYLNSIRGERDKVPPSLAEFARTDRRARRPCFASDANGPGSADREGILLFSKAVREADGSYLAGWAVCLAEDAESVPPTFGIGRMEIMSFVPKSRKEEAEDLRDQIETLDEQLAQGPAPGVDLAGLEARLADKRDALDELTAHRFRALMVHPEGTVTLEKPTAQSMTETMVRLIDERTHDGLYGGVLLRVREGDKVIAGSCADVAATYRDGKVIDGAQAVADYFRFRRVSPAAREAIKRGAVVDLIPTQRINCGPVSNELYSKRAKRQALENTYFDAERPDRAIIRPVAARLVKTSGGGNTLLGNLYATGHAIGNEFELDAQGRPAYQVVEDVTPAPAQRRGHEEAVANGP